MSTIATIEARMGSTRLPGKVLNPLAGAPMLQRIIERVKASKYIHQIVLATTTNDRDDCLVELADQLGIKHFRGSENDVLNRLANAVKKYPSDILVCLTGDNPLVDPELIDDMIDFFLSGNYDYVASTHMQHSNLWDSNRTFPIGVSVQILKPKALIEIDQEISDIQIREHTTYGIYNRTDDKYKRGAFQAQGKYQAWNHPELRFTVDTPEDYTLMDLIWKSLYSGQSPFSTLDAIQMVVKDPALQAINSGIDQRIASRKNEI